MKKFKVNDRLIHKVSGATCEVVANFAPNLYFILWSGADQTLCCSVKYVEENLCYDNKYYRGLKLKELGI